MSALLSPAKPVRTRFKVPGEGAYELCTDLAAPPPRPTAPASSVAASSSSSSSSSQQTPAKPPPPPFAGGPLGLPRVTKLAFAPRVTLHPASASAVAAAAAAASSSASSSSFSSSGANANANHAAGAGGSANAAGGNRPPSPAQSSASPLFSLRRLTALGLSKLGAGPSEDESATQSASASAPNNSSYNASPPVSAAAPATPPQFSSAGPDVALRAPPRVAAASSALGVNLNPNTAAPGLPGGGGPTSSPPSSSALMTPTNAALSSATTPTTTPQQHAATTPSPLPPPPPPPPPTPGVLAYNVADAIVLYDAVARASVEIPLATLAARAPPTCHALSHRDGLRLIVGCANGEVLYFADAAAAAGAGQLAALSASSSGSGGGGGGGGGSSGNGNGAGSGSVGVSGADVRRAARGVASVVVGNGASSTPPAPVIHNKDGAINSARVVAVRWAPTVLAALRFVSVHADGAMIVHEARAGRGAGRSAVVQAVAAALPPPVPDDPPPPEPDSRLPPPTHRRSASATLTRSGSGGSGGGGGGGGTSGAPGGGGVSGSGGSGDKNGGGGDGKTMGMHEVMVTRLSKGKRGGASTLWQIGRASLTACAFSPAASTDSCLFAVTGRDGYLRVVDFARETPVVAFRSYFGALLCVAWSPDGKYVATGGEDDLVSVWAGGSPGDEPRLVARLEGHTSWVSAVAWDAALCQRGRYRIGSAGQDAKLLLWDFSLDVLHHQRGSGRHSAGSAGSAAGIGPAGALAVGTGVGFLSQPSNYAPSSGSTAGSATTGSSSYSGSGKTSGRIAGGGGIAKLRGLGRGDGNGSAGPGWAERKAGKLSRLRDGGNGDGGGAPAEPDMNGVAVPTPVVVAAGRRGDVPVVEPVASHVAHGEPLTDVWFHESGVLTADAAGGVKLWARPPQHAVPELSLGRGGGGGGGGADLD